MMKILIGYDGSDCSEVTLRDLQRAGLPDEVEALVLAVAEVWLPPTSTTSVDAETSPEASPATLNHAYAKRLTAVKEAHELAERARRHLQTLFPHWTVTAESSLGSPAWELIMKADSWQPDLISVGSRGRSMLRRLLLGSVSQRVVAEARCSVRVARDPRRAESSLRLIVGIDGSEASENAVREIAKRLWPAGTKIRLIAVADPSAFLDDLIRSLAEVIDAEVVDEAALKEREVIQQTLDKCAALLQNLEAEITTEIREGDPKHQLVEVAEEWEADCIFVGATGASNQVDRFIVGSVATAIVARAPCTVEVVRRKAFAESDQAKGGEP
jgi:nucleotide-binding universal stress UspA family protein